MRSTQKVQTLRLGRLRGPPSLRSDIDWSLLWGLPSELSEGDVVRVDVTHTGARVVGQRLHLVRRAAGCGARSAAVQELDVVGDDLGRPALLPVLTFPRPGLQTALDVDKRAFPRVLRNELGQGPRAYVPGDDVGVVRDLPPLAVSALAVSVGGDAERRHGLAARRVAHLGVLRKTADQHHLVQVAHSSYSSSVAAVAAGSSAGSRPVSAGDPAASAAATGWASCFAPFAARLISGFRTIRCRKTVSEILSVASISGTRAGSSWKSVSTYWPSRRCFTS